MPKMHQSGNIVRLVAGTSGVFRGLREKAVAGRPQKNRLSAGDVRHEGDVCGLSALRLQGTGVQRRDRVHGVSRGRAGVVRHTGRDAPRPGVQRHDQLRARRQVRPGLRPPEADDLPLLRDVRRRRHHTAAGRQRRQLLRGVRRILLRLPDGRRELRGLCVGRGPLRVPLQVVFQPERCHGPVPVLRRLQRHRPERRDAGRRPPRGHRARVVRMRGRARPVRGTVVRAVDGRRAHKGDGQ